MNEGLQEYPADEYDKSFDRSDTGSQKTRGFGPGGRRRLLVMETLAGALLDAVEQAKANPQPVARWTERSDLLSERNQAKQEIAWRPAEESLSNMAELRRLAVRRNRLDLAEAAPILLQYRTGVRARRLRLIFSLDLQA